MNAKLTVTLEYLGHFKAHDSEDYRVAKITGGPVALVEVTDELRRVEYRRVRIGDLITEKQALELSERHQVITLPKS